MTRLVVHGSGEGFPAEECREGPGLRGVGRCPGGRSRAVQGGGLSVGAGADRAAGRVSGCRLSARAGRLDVGRVQDGRVSAGPEGYRAGPGRRGFGRGFGRGVGRRPGGRVLAVPGRAAWRGVGRGLSGLIGSGV